MINIQFIEFEGELYVIEVNPRASRTVPYISKVSGCSNSRFSYTSNAWS